MTDNNAPGDVFVIFGITGDLAKVMTFRSLYRLEQRNLLDCPIVGVAVEDWTVDQLVERARTSIIGTMSSAPEAALAITPVSRGEWRAVVTTASAPKAHEVRRIAPTLCGSVN